MAKTKKGKKTAQSKKGQNAHIVVQNRKARFNYEIIEEIEAGIMLTGTEVKALRQGKAALTDAFADIKNREVWLLKSFIAEYNMASPHLQHEPYRNRKLLLTKLEIQRLIGKIERKGITLIPIMIYFANNGFAKVKLALGRGKTNIDKRKTIKNREAERELRREMKYKG